MAAAGIVTQPLFFEAHRLSVFTPRSLDIDVVMDLMVHDIDVVLSFIKSEVSEVRAAGVPILTPRIDIANARIEFANGCVANLTASRVSAERVRKLRFFQPREYVSIDYAVQEAAVVSVTPRPRGRPEFESRLLAVGQSEPLRLEIESFLAAVGGAPVKVTSRWAPRFGACVSCDSKDPRARRKAAYLRGKILPLRLCAFCPLRENADDKPAKSSNWEQTNDA
jgi:predicted dehydrogenase